MNVPRISTYLAILTSQILCTKCEFLTASQHFRINCYAVYILFLFSSSLFNHVTNQQQATAFIVVSSPSHSPFLRLHLYPMYT